MLGKARARWFALWLSIAIGVWRTWDLHRHWLDRIIPGLLFGCRTDVRLDALLLGCLAALLLDGSDIRAKFSRRFQPWMWWVGAASYAMAQFTYLFERSRSYSLFASAILPLLVAGTVYRQKTFTTA